MSDTPDQPGPQDPNLPTPKEIEKAKAEAVRQRRRVARRWIDRHLWQIQPVRDILVLLAIIFVFWLGYEISIVTVPLLLAIALAYVFEPVVKWMTKVGWVSREGAVSAIIALTIFLVIVPVVLGLTFAALQGVQLAGSLAATASKMNYAIDHPYNEQAQQDVEGTIPKMIVNAIIDAKENAPVVDEATDEILKEMEEEEGEEQDEADDTEDTESSDLPEVSPSLDELEEERAQAIEDDPLLADDGAPGIAAPEPGETELSANDRRQAEARRSRVRSASEEQVGSAIILALTWIEANAAAVAGRMFRTGEAAFQRFVGIITSFFYMGFTLFLTAFFFFFISVHYEKFLNFGRKFIPAEHAQTTYYLLLRFDKVVSGFIRGRLTIALIQSVVFSVGYYLIGVPASVLLGIVVAILSIVPYAALVGIPVSIVLLWLEPQEGFRGQVWWTLGAPVVFYFFGQALDDYVWTPMIQGKSTGMDTPTILFATIAGGALMGVYGLLLAIPVAACIKIMLEELVWPKFQDWVAGKRSDFLPFDRE